MKNINNMSNSVFENNNLIIKEDSIFIKPLYKNIAYCEINRIELVKGHVIKKWGFSFIVGLSILIYFAIHILQITPFVDPTTTVGLRSHMLIYISSYVFLFFGIYLLYLSLLKKPVIKIAALDNHTYLYTLSKNKDYLSNIVKFLSTRNVELINKLPYGI